MTFVAASMQKHSIGLPQLGEKTHDSSDTGYSDVQQGGVNSMPNIFFIF